MVCRGAACRVLAGVADPGMGRPPAGRGRRYAPARPYGLALVELPVYAHRPLSIVQL